MPVCTCRYGREIEHLTCNHLMSCISLNPIKDSLCFIEQDTVYPYCSVLVGFRNGFDSDFTIKLWYNEGLYDRLAYFIVDNVPWLNNVKINYFFSLNGCTYVVLSTCIWYGKEWLILWLANITVFEMFVSWWFVNCMAWRSVESLTILAQI